MDYSKDNILNPLRNGASIDDLVNTFTKNVNEANALYKKEQVKKQQKEAEKRKKLEEEKRLKEQQRKDAEPVLYYLQKYYPKIYGKATLNDVIQGFEALKRYEYFFTQLL